jgi:hypothetical protein
MNEVEQGTKWAGKLGLGDLVRLSARTTCPVETGHFEGQCSPDAGILMGNEIFVDTAGFSHEEISNVRKQIHEILESIS